ncbi:hypothetical protein NQ176_g1896 [Zarea fungicola]|uniref:Uncharacterized protein n=1 Tax=Zarea fungicola TaxID=93591 RepID=A0ACC1NS16_9HYPO|nr:hypothetical protein NQ176_g1896 [Lecanicillium fungicola]
MDPAQKPGHFGEQHLDAVLHPLVKTLVAGPSFPLDQDEKLTALGLQLLGRRISNGRGQSGEDAINYAQNVIISPQDSKSRASSMWTRSCSSINKKALGMFGSATIESAQNGCRALISQYDNNPLSIAHVDKKENFIRNWKHQLVCRSYDTRSVLSVAAFESAALPSSLALLAWTTPEKAVGLGKLSHLSLCDDYSHFTKSEFDVRIKLIALAVGAAFVHGGEAVNALLDGSQLQAQGCGTVATVESIMAWRAVNGCATPYTGALFGARNSAANLVSPMIMMALHDLYDWRNDTAGNNHENGVSAVQGLGFKDPFHVFLEATIHKAVEFPVPALHAISAITLMHFTAARYGAYEYRGTHKEACQSCVELLKEATSQAQLVWNPQQPPRNFAEGDSMRKGAKAFMESQECRESHDGRELIQGSLSWFQYLIQTGEIYLFDLLNRGVHAVDSGASWV